MLRLAGERGTDYIAPPPELRPGDAGVYRLVDDVVDLAAERVERRDGASAFGRQEQEAVIEARAALRRFLLAVLVGGHCSAPILAASSRRRGGKSARHATRAQSARVSVGRWP